MTADGQIKSFFQRWENLEAEKKQVADLMKDLFIEAKSLGYQPKAMRAAFRLKTKQDLDSPANAEFEAVVDIYLDALNSSARNARLRTRENIEEFDPITGEFVDEPVNAKLVATVASGMQTETGRKALTAAVDIMIAREEAEEEMQHPGSHLIGNPEPALAAANRPNGDDGMVRMARTEASAVTDRRDDHLNCPSDDDAISEVNGNAGLENAAGVEPSSSGQIDPNEDRKEGQSLGGNAGANTGGDHVTDHQSFAAQAGASVQVAPAANGVTYEAFPPMPMKTLGYGHCWPELSKSAYQCLAGDIAINGVLEPIVRMGDVIVDGWNRYNAARSLGIEYPVIRYSGKDVLIDVIGWQRSSRDWTPAQESRIAAALAKEIPHRANDIWAAFHLAEAPEGEEVAA